MSFTVALQSLLFYVVSCAPCHQAMHQRHLKQEAKKQREAKEQEGPDYRGYRQPEPFSTNPYWSEEISMGPHLDRKKHKTPTQRPFTSTCGTTVKAGGDTIKADEDTAKAGKDTAKAGQDAVKTGQDTVKANGSDLVINHDTYKSYSTYHSSSWTTIKAFSDVDSTDAVDTNIVHRVKTASTNIVSSEKGKGKPDASVGHVTSAASTTNADTLSAVETGNRGLSPDTLPDNWNHKRYQREDEEVWGAERARHLKILDAINNATDRFIESKNKKNIKLDSDDENDTRYFGSVNPPVNDHHPPILRRDPLAGAIRWMVQPPPPARVMEGKVPVRPSMPLKQTTVPVKQTVVPEKYWPKYKFYDGPGLVESQFDLRPMNPIQRALMNGVPINHPALRRDSSSTRSGKSPSGFPGSSGSVVGGQGTPPTSVKGKGPETKSPDLPEESLKVPKPPRRPLARLEREWSSNRSGWDDIIKPYPRGIYTDNPDKYDSAKFVKRKEPQHIKWGKVFVRPRLGSDCFNFPRGIGLWPDTDPVQTTYREELGIPR
ncbi:hypothetical protein GGS24DRAFT_512906 [Hypoxylon argillaceum]|nr:hypothetical protein GGS24DRAFT_512906 [Hypoxylon argillaceum]